MNVVTPTPHRPPTERRHTPLLRWMALLLTALTAIAAYAGAVGLIGGGTDFGPAINEKLPWQSPVLTGVALAVLVAVPLTVATWQMWRVPQAAWPTIAIIAGLWLIAWIVLQLLVIGAVHPLQAMIAGIGVAVLLLGVLGRGRNRPGLSTRTEHTG